MDLLTGATGIVGVHLLHAYASQGRRIRALYRRSSDRSVVEAVFRHYDPGRSDLLELIEWVEGELHDMGSLADAMTGVSRVYHAAALVSFDPADKRVLFKINTEGTANVVNAALASGVERLCHVSSTAAIGSAPPGTMRDERTPWTSDPHISPYSASKYEAELEIHRGIAEGLDAVIVNPCIVIGPGARGRSTMTLLEKLRKGTRFYPPGTNAVVDARDVAACMISLMGTGHTGERYLLVGENLSYQALFNKLSEAFGRPAPKFALTPAMLQAGWRMEAMRTFLFRGRPLVTRATAESAITVRSYDNAKAVSHLQYRFRTADEAIANVAAYMEGLD